MRKTLEICTQNIQSVEAAQRAGADRVELCTGLELGGLTPSAALTEMTLECFSGKTFVLLRPRPGHFVYDKQEIQLIIREARFMAKLGVHGIVFGALNDQYEVDSYAVESVRDAVSDLEFTFHRALDVAIKPESEIEKLIKLKIPRVLTSGAAGTAMESVHRLSDWVKKYGEEMVFLIGGGVRSANLEKLISTGAREFHLSAQMRLDESKSGDLIPGDFHSSNFDEILKCRQLLDKSL